MTVHTPKLLGNVEKHLVDKLHLALANREKEVNVLVGISKEEARRALHKLRAMRAGLKQYQPEGSELQVLAKDNFIKFGQDYLRSQGPGREYNVYMKIYAAEHVRPSAAFEQAFADYKNGLRSTPF